MYKTELLSRARNFSVGDDSTEDKTEMENRRRTLMNEKRQLDSDADKYLKEEDKLRGDLSSITSMLVRCLFCFFLRILCSILQFSVGSHVSNEIKSYYI